jgi:hypothetical protein
MEEKQIQLENRIQTLRQHFRELLEIHNIETTQSLIGKRAQQTIGDISFLFSQCSIQGTEAVLFSDSYDQIIQSIEQFNKERRNRELVSLFTRRFTTNTPGSKEFMTGDAMCIRTDHSNDGSKFTLEMTRKEVGGVMKQVKQDFFKHCFVCRNTSSLKICGGCHCYYYCCKEHQQEHWVTHRDECQKLQKDFAGLCSCCGTNVHLIKDRTFVMDSHFICVTCFVKYNDTV